MASINNTPRPAYVYDTATNEWIPIGVGAHSHNEIPKTVVDAKGDLIVGTAADEVNRLAVGSNGDTLVADGSTTTGLRYNPPVGSLPQPVINGGMDVWQRGTSFAVSSGATNFYTADRWSAYRAAAGATVSRQTTSDTTNLPNIQYAARVQRDSGNTSTVGISFLHTFESVNSIPFAGKTVTLSFYARAGANYSNSGSTLEVNLATGTGTDQNLWSGFTGRANPILQYPVLTTTWQRFSFSATIATTATQIAFNFSMTPVGTAGANDWFEITGVQLDVGTWTASTAPTFRRSGGTLAGELAACCRYFERITNGGTASGGAICNSYAVGANDQSGVIFFIEKRVVPSTVLSAASGFVGGATAGSSVAVARPTTKSIRLDLTVTGSPYTTGQGNVIRWADSSTGSIDLSAEL